MNIRARRHRGSSFRRLSRPPSSSSKSTRRTTRRRERYLGCDVLRAFNRSMLETAPFLASMRRDMIFINLPRLKYRRPVPYIYIPIWPSSHNLRNGPGIIRAQSKLSFDNHDPADDTDRLYLLDLPAIVTLLGGNNTVERTAGRTALHIFVIFFALCGLSLQGQPCQMRHRKDPVTVPE